MKKNQINFDHSAATISAALGLTAEHENDVRNRVDHIVKEESSQSKKIEKIISEYEDDPAKQAFALVILLPEEGNIAFDDSSEDLEEEEEASGSLLPSFTD